MIAATLPLEEALQRLGLWPRSSERQALYRAAVRELDLTVIDYQTVRDLLEMARIDADPAVEAALFALFVARNEGSLCVRAEADSLLRRLPDFPGREELVARFLANLHAGAYDGGLIGHEETAFLPVIHQGDYLYFQRYLRDACRLRDSLHTWLAQNDTGHPECMVLRSIVDEVISTPLMASGEQSIRLNDQQQLALALALLQPFTVITGGPGTGKTLIIVAILRSLVRLGIAVERISLAAPTGRAAQRMSESLRGQLLQLQPVDPIESRLAELDGKTIHHLLGYSPSRNTFTFTASNPLAVDAVIVDEVSMIDVTLMASLLDAVPPGARLILLGDARQLPSVEAGAVLADLAPAGEEPRFSPGMARAIREVLPSADVTATPGVNGGPVDRVVRLVHSHRSGPEIMAVASLINTYTDADETALLALLSADDAACAWEVADGESAAAWWACLSDWARHHYLDSAYCQTIRACTVPETTQQPCDGPLASILHHLSQARILTAIHGGRYGCDGINAFLAEVARPHLDPGCHGRYFAGAPVLIERNDYTLELFNGDTGVVLHDIAGGYRVAFQRGDNVVLIPPDSLPEHRPGFAMTVHKSQGSEYGHVLLVLPTGEAAASRRLLTREILYTGLTRARHTAQIHATRDALLQACRTQVRRDSGLSLWDDPAQNGVRAG